MLPSIKRILYATDLSESARRALRYAVSMARCHGADLTIIHVVPDLLETMSEDAGFDLHEAMDEQAWRDLNSRGKTRALETARGRVREMAAECATDDPACPVARADIRIEQGDAAARILDEIATGRHDMVVMGAHGRGEIMDMLFGSVARKVVRRSPVPVLTVRLPENSDQCSESVEKQ
ncbi:MAG: universal stress protein [Deltaproteobacteria bacterium]|nr:universal stress protein [Deltaproteobacteria bacterium]